MKYHIICFLLLLISLCSNAQIRIVDGTDGSPVQAASVFVDSGKCVGVSDSNGTLPLPKGYTGTVTVQHLSGRQETCTSFARRKTTNRNIIPVRR